MYPVSNAFLMEGKIIHGGQPVLRWMAGNVVVDTDPAGNIKVTKAKSKEKMGQTEERNRLDIVGFRP